MVSAKEKPQLLVIVGETASGKSHLALKLARKFNGEIISADSWMVYKGFDIGTAKPTASERKEVKHHLIDVAEPQEGYSAPIFKRMAQAAITDIQHRGRLPILVGGTGLYIDSLIFDYGFLPAASPKEREQLNSLSIAELISKAKKNQIDLEDIDLRNKRRIIRAIEAKGQKPSKKELQEGVLVVGLAVSPEELREKVEIRLEKMFTGGLEQEVKQLAKHLGWNIEPMKGIGYREFKPYFGGAQTLGETNQKIISSTLNLAKKQRTWFRRNKFIRWFASPEQAYQEVSRLLNK